MNSLRILLVIFAFSSSFAQLTNFAPVSEWKELEYDFASAEDKQHAIDLEEYIPKRGVPIDVQVHYNRRSGWY